jgi:chemotaxis protein methyltransferase CheR
VSGQPIRVDGPRLDLARSDVERFRAAIVQQIGLQFDDGKLAFLGDVLCRRLNRLSCSSASYLGRLEEAASRGELSALAQELTIGETYFFRHNDQFRALAEVVLPERMCARENSRTLRLMSAGCASGEEAYSLAIVAKETVVDPSWHVAIEAIDLNPVVLEKAARARYSPWALREAPAEVQRKWFRSESRELIVDETVRTAVHFDRRNLASDDPELWQPGGNDVIFCRNVLMYFAPEQMRAAIARMAQSLAPGGYLFLGHAETLRGISDEFHLRHSHDTFYYKRKDEIGPARPQTHPVMTAAGFRAPPAMTQKAALSTAWVDTIRQASERVAALVSSASPRSLEAPRPRTGWRLAPVFDLLRHERLREALDYVCNGPPQIGSDPDVLLIKAVLQAQSGQVAAAEDACQRLLLIDELNAGAHYVLALCREHSGESARAIEHDRLAAHLDPAFAMPRLHCGLLARRSGDRDLARRELAQALVLLKREDVSRLLLFGGGFSRDALIALCQSAVAESGGRP